MPDPFGESGDGLSISDVGNRISCLREASDEVTQGLPEGLMNLLQVILGAGLLTLGHVIVGEDFLEVIPRLDGVLPQAEELVICRLVKHDGKIVRHDVFISAHDFHSDLI